MATITGLTAARMLEIEAQSVVDGEVVGGNLILTQHGGVQINAGSVVGPQGPQGPVGPAAVFAIPGEVKLWSGATLPAIPEYGRWVWADGTVYAVATYPKAAAHIAPAWRTFAGASDPGAGNFRVPDLRGLVPAGMDAMPGGARANRMTRSVAITLAARTGEELHVVTINEMPAHAHTVNDPQHQHALPGDVVARPDTGAPGGYGGGFTPVSSVTYHAFTGIYLSNNGGGGAHENVQPTVFVPYIVKLDD